MKKMLASVLLGCTFAFSGLTGAIPFSPMPIILANDIYPEHLWGDSNYQLVYGHMDVGNYIDWSSFTLLQDSGKGPGQTIFAVNVLNVNMKTNTVIGTDTYQFVDDSRKGHFVRINEKAWMSFDPEYYVGYMATIVNTYKACMLSLRD